MSTNSAIAWTRHTLNLWWGCVEVSPLCDNCYAREWAARYDRAKWGADQPRLYIKSGWTDVFKWQRAAAEAGRIDNVFCGSMMDIFEKPMPVVDSKGDRMEGTTGDLRNRLFNEIVPACPNLLFLLLTKRPGNIPEMVPESWHSSRPHNVIFGASMGTYREVERDVPKLLQAPGRTFISIEPLLESIDLYNSGALVCDWIIAGCESLGARAGRFQHGYAAAVRDMIIACWNDRVPFFHKQMPINGRVSHDPDEWPEDLRVRNFPAPR